ncbi:MAG: hypothetical protein ACI9LX_002956, partial [Paraglaciecola sp.]
MVDKLGQLASNYDEQGYFVLKNYFTKFEI